MTAIRSGSFAVSASALALEAPSADSASFASVVFGTADGPGLAGGVGVGVFASVLPLSFLTGVAAPDFAPHLLHFLFPRAVLAATLASSACCCSVMSFLLLFCPFFP